MIDSESTGAGSLFIQIIRTIFKISIDVLIMVGPILAYLKQISLIKKNRSIGAFSYDVCAILLFGQAMRIFFW